MLVVFVKVFVPYSGDETDARTHRRRKYKYILGNVFNNETVRGGGVEQGVGGG